MRVELRAEQSRLSSEQSQLSTERLQVQSAQAAAKNAMSTALAQIQAQYKSRLASVQSLQRKLQREQGVVQKSTISADGVYVVGKDIPAGVYHTTGGAGQCYYATLGSTDTSNILDNNIFNGPETVDVSGVYAVQITGGCTWTKTG
jgi:carboxypeptidase C (cathepsin A)